MRITWPTNTPEIIDTIRGAIGRDVTFYVRRRTICPSGHGIDPTTDTSKNPFCTVCSGEGYITVYSGYTVSGHISWAPSETMQWVTGGKFYESDCGLQIKYTADNLEIVNTADYVVVDDKELKINKKTFRGVKELNRILLDLKAR